MHNKRATIEELLETVFSVGSKPRLYGELPSAVTVSSSGQPQYCVMEGIINWKLDT
jgi:hypothetical protein